MQSNIYTKTGCAYILLGTMFMAHFVTDCDWTPGIAIFYWHGMWFSGIVMLLGASLWFLGYKGWLTAPGRASPLVVAGFAVAMFWTMQGLMNRALVADRFHRARDLPVIGRPSPKLRVDEVDS